MKKLYKIQPVLYTAFTILFSEVILRYSTTGGPLFPFLFFTGVLSLFYSCLIALVTSLFSEKVNFILRTVIYTCTAVLFLVNFFLFRQFKVFYDMKTVFAGAGGVLSGFTDNIKHMVFSADGMFHIFLLFLPAVLFVIFRKKMNCAPSDTDTRFMLGSLCLGLPVFVLIFISGNPVYARSFSSEYNFQKGVNQYGLLSAFPLDMYHTAAGESEFVIAEEPEVTETPEPVPEPEETEEPEPTPTPVVYEYNTLDIDFENLDTSNQMMNEMDEYVSSLSGSKENEYTGLFKGKNLILITAEAFSAEVIDKDLTPTLYRLANKGIQFTDYYQTASAGTTGGEYEVVFGMLPTNGGSSFKKMTGRYNCMTMGSLLNDEGYYGMAFHNNTYTFYDRHLTHQCLGYSEGFMGYGSGIEEYVSKGWPESDLEMMQGTLDLYIDHEPFNIYYMTVSGHNEYTLANDMSEKNYDRVKDLDCSEIIKCYLAANLELEDALTYLVDKLEEKGIADDTVIVMSADHFPYGLDEDNSLRNLAELYGQPITSSLYRDHNRLIIWSGCLEKEEPIVVDDPVSSLDILPTLCNLFDTEWDSRLFPGRDVFSDTMPLVFNIEYDWKTDLGMYRAGSGVFTPNDENAEIPEDYTDRIRQIVSNKILYCRNYNNCDYFRHLFEPEEEEQAGGEDQS